MIAAMWISAGLMAMGFIIARVGGRRYWSAWGYPEFEYHAGGCILSAAAAVAFIGIWLVWFGMKLAA